MAKSRSSKREMTFLHGGRDDYRQRFETVFRPMRLRRRQPRRIAVAKGRHRPMLLKKSVPSCSARFSWVVLPLTKTHERLVGRSERSKFSTAARQQHAATFSTTSANFGRSIPMFRSLTIGSTAGRSRVGNL